MIPAFPCIFDFVCTLKREIRGFGMYLGRTIYQGIKANAAK